ncbi:MAG: PD-(D/E)XK nuclease family protein, partial [Patescibacteria group bacterium]
MRISYSGLELYRACPYLFKYVVLDKNKLPKSKEQVFGTVIHESLRYMFNPNPLFPVFDQIIDFFKSRWSEKSAKIDLKNEDERNAYLNKGILMLERFYKKNQPWNFNVLDLESRFEVPLDDPENGQMHQLTGIIDRIDKVDEENYEIIDYKTSKRMPSQDRLDQNLQLSLYNLG